MDIGLLRSMLTVIATEEEMRKSILNDGEEAQFGYDEWIEEHRPFVNSMYLLVMVSIWHHVERELVLMAARKGSLDSPIPTGEYRHAVTNVANPRGRLGRLKRELELQADPDWNSIDVLRALANDFKHGPFNQPQKELLEKLGLDPNANYRSLNESPELCRAFCSLLGLGVSTEYKDVSRSYVDVAERFLKNVRTNTQLRPLKGTRASSRADRAAR